MSATPHPLVPIPGRRCRASGASDLLSVLDLGELPLADILLTEDQLAAPDPVFPLELAFSPTSALLQLVDTVPGELAYDDAYPYYTSVLPGLVEHFRASATSILAARELDASSLVVEAASNDGYMLRPFAEAGVPVLGVDPAPGPVAVAREHGIESICDFFTAEVAEDLRSRRQPADVVLGNNIVNLVPDPADFARAVRTLLADDGIAVLEVPYAVEMVEQCEYDTIFHQNVSYFSLTSLVRLFGEHDLGVVDVERIPTFGGSLRVRFSPGAVTAPAAEALLAREADAGVPDAAYYAGFAARAERSRDALVELIEELRRAGQRVVAYGAGGGMATTLLGYAGLGADLLDYAVDGNPHKQGRYTPGSRLPIHPPERLLEDRPGHVLLLAWNYASEIMADQREFRAGGGRFIIPIPEPRVV